jgi:LigXa C-terminal domain like
MIIGVRRPAPDGQLYWRITQWIMPFHTMMPPYGENALNGHAWVPVDDENCMSWCFTHHPTRPLTAHELDTMRNGGGIHVSLIPGTFRPVVNKDNDYLIDRAAQKANRTYCGVAGIAMQDAAIQESMGPIQDRSKENLVSTDNGVIMARIRLRKAAQGGAEPDGIDPAALGLDRAAGERQLLRGRRRRADRPGRRGAHVGVNYPPTLCARTGTDISPIGSILASMVSPGVTGLTPSGVPVNSTSPG